MRSLVEGAERGARQTLARHPRLERSGTPETRDRADPSLVPCAEAAEPTTARPAHRRSSYKELFICFLIGMAANGYKAGKQPIRPQDLQ